MRAKRRRVLCFEWLDVMEEQKAAHHQDHRRRWPLLAVTAAGIVVTVLLVTNHSSLQRTAASSTGDVALEDDTTDEIWEEGRNASTKVLIVTSGRTGSTLLSDVLSLIPNSYNILEPYKAYGRMVGLSPPFRDLFSCRIFDSVEDARRIMWNYECINDRNLDNFPEIKARCMAEKMLEEDFAVLGQACRNASVRIVKTVRFDDHHNMDYVKKETLHLIFLTRSTWSVLKSQFILGWHRPPPDLHGLDAALASANDACVRMVHSYEMLWKQVKARNYSLWEVTFEHFLTNPVGETRRMYDYIGVPFTAEMEAKVAKIAKKSHGPTTHLKKSREKMISDEYYGPIMALPSCMTAQRIHEVILQRVERKHGHSANHP